MTLRNWNFPEFVIYYYDNRIYSYVKLNEGADPAIVPEACRADQQAPCGSLHSRDR